MNNATIYRISDEKLADILSKIIDIRIIRDNIDSGIDIDNDSVLSIFRKDDEWIVCVEHGVAQ